MWQVSDGFLAALKNSHTIGVKAEIWSAPPNPQRLAVLTSPSVLVDGSVTVDVNNAIRRQAKLQLIDPAGTLTPTLAGDMLTPFGNELYLYRGITYPTVTDSLVPLGVFGLFNVEIDDDPAGGLTISIDAYDRAQKVSRAKLTDSYAIAAGVDYAPAIQALLSSRVAGLTFAFPPATGYLTPVITLNAGDDPWQQAQQMAASIGYDLHFDQAGQCALTLISDPSASASVDTYAEGAGARVLRTKKKMTADGVFNDVIASGNSTSNATPPSGRAQDTNPASPTYISGGYGDVVEFVTSDLITTSAQALAFAQATLYRALGIPEQVLFDAIVNPAHDGGDVVTITRARSKISANYVIDALTIPLKADVAMSATTRRQV